MNELVESETQEEFLLWGNKKLNNLVIEYNHTLSLNLDPKHPAMKGPLKFLAIAKQQTAFMCGYDCVAFVFGFGSHEGAG